MNLASSSAWQVLRRGGGGPHQQKRQHCRQSLAEKAPRGAAVQPGVCVCVCVVVCFLGVSPFPDCGVGNPDVTQIGRLEGESSCGAALQLLQEATVN